VAIDFVSNLKVIGILETQVRCFEIWDRDGYITEQFIHSSYTWSTIWWQKWKWDSIL